MKYIIAVTAVLVFLGAVSAIEYPDIYWRDYNGIIPKDALPTGHDLYIAQVFVKETKSNVPGTLYPDKRKASTEVVGKKVTIESNFKVLCTREPYRFVWQRVNIKALGEDDLKNCVVGGYESNSPLYIGKILHEDEWKIGKVFPASSQYAGLRTWNNAGEQYSTDELEILKFYTCTCEY